MDTDSFLLGIETIDLFPYMFDCSDLFDTSDFPPEHFLHSNVTKSDG